MRRILWLSLVLLTLMATACAGGASSDDDLVVGEDDTSLPEPDVGDGNAEAVDVAAQLASALSNAGDDTSYRLDAAQGTTLRVPGIGLNQIVPLDEDRLANSTIVDGDEGYIDMNLSAVFGPLGTDDDITLQMWTTPERVVIDSTDYQALLELNPAADLGPFSPGVSSIDLTAIAGDSDDLVTAISGSGPISIGAITAALLEALENVSIGDDARTYRGTAVYGAIIEAQGGDAEELSRSIAAGLALNLGVDVDALTEVYVDLYRNAPTSVTVVLDEAGLLSEIRLTTDLAAIYSSLPSVIAAQTPDVDESELLALFADPIFEVDQVLFIDLDPGEIPPAPDATEDRTDEWLDFLEANGF